MEDYIYSCTSYYEAIIKNKTLGDKQMKNVTIIATALTILFSTPVIAQIGAKGGFNGPSDTITTVEQALKMKDDTFVTLQGKIEQRIGDEEYLFRDNTGIITVEIDDDKWGGLVVNPEDSIEIKGEVDKGWRKTEIDVSEIKKIK
jgi:uncharacterized protein (TIGR00156 family)